MGNGPRFSPKEIVQIRNWGLEGVSVANIARHHKVNFETIRRILRGETYAGVRVWGQEHLEGRPRGGGGLAASGSGRMVTEADGTEREETLGERAFREMLEGMKDLKADPKPPDPRKLVKGTAAWTAAVWSGKIDASEGVDPPAAAAGEGS